MENKDELISALIGKTIGLYPTEVALLLNKNGVVIDADTFDIDQLISATFNGINTSPAFKQDLAMFIDSKGILSTSTYYSNADGAGAGAGAWIGGATALLGSVTNYLGSKDQLKATKANALATLEANKTAKEIALINQQTALAQLQYKSAPSSNKTLYIGLGVGGFVVVGMIIYFVTKK